MATGALAADVVGGGAGDSGVEVVLALEALDVTSGVGPLDGVHLHVQGEFTTPQNAITIVGSGETENEGLPDS